MTHRTALFSLVILLTMPIAVIAQNANRTFTKSFNTDSKGIVRLDLINTIDLKIWDNPTIRIDINVSLPSGMGPMMNELANVGRYNLVAKPVPEDDMLIISAPNLQKQIKVKGEELKEMVSYVIFVPKNIKVEMPNPVTMADPKK